MGDCQLFKKLNDEFYNSLRIYDTFTRYKFKNIYISLSICGLDYPKNTLYFIHVRNYIPCKTCYHIEDLDHTISYNFSDPNYLTIFNVDVDCDNCNKFINLVTGRNIFSKYIINYEKDYMKRNQQIIDILLCRYEKFSFA